MNRQLKKELTEVCATAIREHLRGTRGAAQFGAGADVTEPSPNNLLIKANAGVGAPIFFEVKIKETF